MIQRHLYVLAVPDLEVSAAFYCDVLGFAAREVGDPGWRLLARDQCSILIGHCPDAIPARDLGDHSYFGYLVVDDVEAAYERAVAQGAELIKPLRDEPWGMREFGLRTADGHRLMLGQELEPEER